MKAAEKMKSVASSAKKKAADKQKQEAAAKVKLEKEIDAEVKAGIRADYEKKWLPLIKQAAVDGNDTVTLNLGSRQYFLGWPKGFDLAYEARQRATVKYLTELLEKEGFKVGVSYPDRKYSDDDPGREEIDIKVEW
jgi:hypothetical protein